MKSYDLAKKASLINNHIGNLITATTIFVKSSKFRSYRAINAALHFEIAGIVPSNNAVKLESEDALLTDEISNEDKYKYILDFMIIQMNLQWMVKKLKCLLWLKYSWT